MKFLLTLLLLFSLTCFIRADEDEMDDTTLSSYEEISATTELLKILSSTTTTPTTTTTTTPKPSTTTTTTQVTSTTGHPKDGKKWRFESCSSENLDSCAKFVLLFGYRDLTIPHNLRESKEFCDEEKEALECVFDWGTNCIKGFNRQMFRLLMRGASKNIKERCSKRGMRTFLKNKSCVNSSMEGCHDCMDDITKDVWAIMRNPNKKEWIPTGCCYINKFKECFGQATEAKCDQEGKNWMMWCVDSYLSDMMDVICQKDIDFYGVGCQEMLSHIKPETNETVAPAKSSLISPLYKLMLEFGNSED